MTISTDDQITFIIKADASGKASVEIEKESQELLKQKNKETSSDVMTAMIDIVLNTINKGTNEIMKLIPHSVAVKYHNFKINAITVPISYITYLADERKIHGDPGFRAEIVAASQTAGGVIFSLAGGVVGSTAGSAAAPGIGTVAGGFGGTITAAVTYDVVDIAGQPAKDWIGGAVRSLYPLTSPIIEKHTVQIGDTLSEIARKYHTNVAAILKDNKAIINPDFIKPGDQITLPKKPAEKTSSESSDGDVDYDFSAEFVGSATVAMAGGLGMGSGRGGNTGDNTGGGTSSGRSREKAVSNDRSGGMRDVTPPEESKKKAGSKDSGGNKGSGGNNNGKGGDEGEGSGSTNSNDNPKGPKGPSGGSGGTGAGSPGDSPDNWGSKFRSYFDIGATPGQHGVLGKLFGTKAYDQKRRIRYVG